jgi:hypothetical protein
VQAVLLTVPWVVPAGLAAGGAAWARHCWAVTTGISGGSAFAAASFDTRHWRRHAAAARGALTAPGTVPLATRAGDAVPAGPVIRAVGTRWHPVLAVPAFLFLRHMVIVGASGTGKTNLMIRRQAAATPAAYAAAAAAYQQLRTGWGEARPWPISPPGPTRAPGGGNPKPGRALSPSAGARSCCCLPGSGTAVPGSSRSARLSRSRRRRSR